MMNGVVLATARPVLRTGGRRQPVPTGPLVLDEHEREVVLDVRRERGVHVQAGEVAVCVVQLVVGAGTERLTAQAGHRQDRDERHPAVLAGQVELRVDPLHLEQPGDVGVEVQTAARGARAFATTSKAAGGARVVPRETAVVRAPGLHLVDLDAGNGLGAADRDSKSGRKRPRACHSRSPSRELPS